MMGTALQLLFSLFVCFYMFVIQQYIIDHKKTLVLQTMDLSRHL